jgi:hypothetical protein
MENCANFYEYLNNLDPNLPPFNNSAHITIKNIESIGLRWKRSGDCFCQAGGGIGAFGSQYLYVFCRSCDFTEKYVESKTKVFNKEIQELTSVIYSLRKRVDLTSKSFEDEIKYVDGNLLREINTLKEHINSLSEQININSESLKKEVSSVHTKSVNEINELKEHLESLNDRTELFTESFEEELKVVHAYMEKEINALKLSVSSLVQESCLKSENQNSENQELKSLIYGMLDEINELKEHNRSLSERILLLENKPPVILY